MLELFAAESNAAPSVGYGALAALVLFIVGSMWIGRLAQQVVEKGAFLKTYFLGNRGLGAWTIALTATVQSGGTFMGFPSLVYAHGWIVALWIAGYMMVPLTGFGVLGKRIAQISRKTGAVTIPDLYRARFESPTTGLVCSLVIILCMTVMMIAQFKAGALIMQLAWPDSGMLAITEDGTGGSRGAYLTGLVIFSVTVVFYTLIGGFLAAVWTDLFQSLMMFVGVVLLLCLVLTMSGGLEKATTSTIEKLPAAEAGSAFHHSPQAIAAGPGYKPVKVDKDGKPQEVAPFLPLTKAISFFIFWPFVGMASPAGVVRIMACKDTPTLRKSVFILCLYNLGIYLPLVMICICARSLMPDLANSDEVIPRTAMLATDGLPGGSFLAGLILAAPFGAVMATVSSYLVVIASGIVRDIYQRLFRPDANEYELRRASYIAMIGIGLLAMLAVVNPPDFLQKMVVFSSGAVGASFTIPTFMLCYWRRATATGVIWAMVGGAGTVFGLNLIGILREILSTNGNWARYESYDIGQLGFDPFIWGMLISLVFGIVGSLLSKPPSDKCISALFDA